MSKLSDIGPSAPWYDPDSPDFLDDDELLFTEAMEEARQMLAEALQRRIEALDSDALMPLMEEIRRQMATAAAEARFGEARNLHDIALSLLLAQDQAKRAV